MLIQVDRSGTVEDFKRLIKETASQKGIEGLLVLAATGNHFSPSAIDPILLNIKLPAYGGAFPAIIFGKEHLERGSIVVGLSRRGQT